MLLVLAQMASAKTELVSNDPNWLGGRATFNTTEGNDFWLTFMNNNTFDPDAPDNKSIKFEMQIAISASETMDVVIAIGNSTKTVTVPANETYIYELDRDDASQIYLLTSEKDGYQGVHVYAAQKDKDKFFSCFLYNRSGETGGSSRDASLVIPTRFLGKEYIIQTAPEDFISTEFAIVATESNTTVRIKPTFETFGGQSANNEFTVSLNKGQAYLIASKQHEGDTDFNEDLSGSTICSDKPIAVFNGNQQTSFPIDEARTRDHVIEQALPTDYWGKDFYISLLDSTKSNVFIITAGPEGANVTIKGFDPATNTPTTETIPIGAFASSDPITISPEFSEMVIHSDKPIMCYDYLTSGIDNIYKIGTGSQALTVYYCDPGNAMLPAWNHRVKSMNFFTHDLDPMKSGNKSYPQTYYVYLVAPAKDQGKLTVDGNVVTLTPFRSENGEMAYASYWITNPATHYHSIESSGEGFVGMVYGISYVQGYLYTLGYNPNPYGDSLFINNTKPLMSAASYDMDSLDGHGWYQRQWDEWVEGKERLDTAVVCDGSTVYWTMETHPDRPVKEIEWNIYDRTTEEEKGEPQIIANGDVTNPGSKYKLERKFELPIEEDMEDRHQFFEYELELILHRAKVFCEGDDDTDTFRTVTRVTRMFNDTVWRAICIGDTLEFFSDSLYNQDDLSKYKAGEKDTTLFIATKAGTGYIDKPWNYNVDLGTHSFTRSYQSQFGCDSLITLELFVCDTFRFVDTAHLCNNDTLEYHDTIYCWKEYKITDWDPKKHYKRVDKDTTVQYVRFKTNSCDCQKGEWMDKYKRKDGKKFQGCDSIYELHLYIHPSYEVKVTDTLDYKEHPDSIYVWHTEIDTDGDGIPDQPKDSIIDKRKYSTTDEYWDRKKQAWIVRLADTLYTKTCSECNEGQGCDSINAITVIFPKVYRYSNTVKHCRLSYDWSRHDTLRQDFQWFGHHHDTIYTKTGIYYDSCVSRYGADSIYYLNLIYSQAVEPLYHLVDTTVCFDSINKFEWVFKDNIHVIDTIPLNQVGTFYYVDDTTRCDSIYALKLTVLPTYWITKDTMITEEEVYVWPIGDTTSYGGPKATQPYDKPAHPGITSDTLRFLTKAVNNRECDSVHVLILHMGNVYRDTVDTFVCGQAEYYDWYGKDHDGNDSLRMTICNSGCKYPLPEMGETKIYEDKHLTTLEFDSIFYLKLYRAPSYKKDTTIGVCQDTVNLFTWKEHADRTLYEKFTGTPIAATDIPLDKAGDFYYIDSLLTKKYLCDSIWELHLHVDPIIDKDTTVNICQFDDYSWSPETPDSIIDASSGKKIDNFPTNHAGEYKYHVMFHTPANCHSVWHLTLHIDTVYTEPVSITPRFMCDKDTIMIFDRVIYGINSPLRPEGVGGLKVPEDVKFIEKDTTYTAKTINGCDSLVQHHIHVYKTYADTARIRVGQPSEGRDSLFHWVHHDTVWDVHNSRFIPADSIPRYVKGDTTYLYIDSLRTTACTTCERIKEGCDSLFFLYLTIDSTFHFYDTIHICENEDSLWQNIHFVGDSVPKIYWQTGDSIRKPGIYDERQPYTTKRYLGECDTCAYDSIYYLHLIVTPVYHDVTPYVYCDNDTTRAAHYYSFSDTHGNVYDHHVRFIPNKPRSEADTSYTYYNPIDTTLTDTLVTVDGCDSIVTVNIRILPTYEFVARGKGCFGDTVYWRGGKYYKSDIYFDSLKTKDGCDSVFVLEFQVKPVVTVPIYDTICDNETYVHTDTLWYTNALPYHNEYTTFEELVWKPGMRIPQTYTQVTFRSPYDGCDSIIYHYYLNICKTYYQETSTTLCTGLPYEYTFGEGDDAFTHVWQGPAFEYDTNVYVPAFDSIFYDSLQTVMGCDSVFALKAHVLPSYRHIEYDTICENDSCHFRKYHFLPVAFGDTIVRDTLYTEHKCDSIYELRLSVYPKYLNEEFDTICADETYTWRDSLYIYIPAGDNLLYDSLKTIHGCDSVYHMYLYVKDTTNTVRYDTICYGDTLFISETGHIYTVPGDYKDTTLNEWGCHHFIYTHLAQIPPTVPTVWAEDAMCQDTTSFYLYYTYTSHYPIAYSLYFDEAGKSMGFEDMINVPIDKYTDPMFIKVPIPYRDDDPTKYPRPGNYSVRLVLDNGICRHKESDCFHDSTFIMSYPSWLTEQRYGDVIALLNEKYNGGYKWSAYQWYQGSKKLVGQTNPYLYIPTGLEDNTEYHVVLTREGENQSFPTCPITVTYDSRFNQYAPTMGYLDVAPTCITTGHPYTTILSRHGGRYRVTTSSGSAITSGNFHADATEIQVPSTSGMYIVQLWSDDTPEEPYRAIKIVVKDICETCATSF